MASIKQKAYLMCTGLAEWWLCKGLEAGGLGWLARLSIVIHTDVFQW